MVGKFLGVDGKYHPDGSFLGVDGKYHPKGYFQGVDGKYHPAGSFQGTDGRYHRAGEFQELWHLRLADSRLTRITGHIPWDVSGGSPRADGARSCRPR